MDKLAAYLGLTVKDTVGITVILSLGISSILIAFILGM